MIPWPFIVCMLSHTQKRVSQWPSYWCQLREEGDSLSSATISSIFWGAGTLGFLLAKSIDEPHNHTLDMKNKSLLPLSFSSFLSLIYPRLALNFLYHPEWPWMKIKWPVFLPLSSECRDYGHTPPQLVYVVLRIEYRLLFMLGKHSTNWTLSPDLQLLDSNVQCLKFLFVLGQVLSVQLCLTQSLL